MIQDEFTTGVENYKEFFYALVGIAGEGQNFDGNGMYVRFQTGGGSQSVSLGPSSTNGGELFGNNIGVPLGNRPAYPGKRPPYRPDVPCYKQKLPNVNGPAAAKTAPSGGTLAAKQGKTRARQAAQAGRAGGRAPQAQPVRRQAPLAGGEAEVKTAIRKHLPDFLAILGLLIVAAAVSTVILGKQRLALPAWVPLIGQDFFEFEAEMSTAQAVTPGQGQTVNIAGVEVGEIASVTLRDGKAIIGMKIEPKHDRIYKDASILLRPKTGLKDMVAELTPGTEAAGQLEEGGVIPISQTLPDVNLDEILAALDADTRDYLLLLLNDGAEGLGSERKGRELAQAIRRIEPTAKYARQINEGLAERRRNLARVVHNFSLLTDELGQRDTQLANFVQNSNAVFETLAEQDASLRASLQRLPGTLNTTQETLGKVDTMAQVLGPTLEELRPAARALGPSLRQTRPFLRETTPIIEDEIRPFTRAALPTVEELRPAMRDLAATTPDLTRSFNVVNRLLNTAAYNPPGEKEEGFLFWQSWVNHAGNAIFSTQDAHGPIRRGLIVLSCSTAQLLDAVAQANPQLGTLVELLNAPTQETICPSSTQAPGGG